jgi:hypothetical protein
MSTNTPISAYIRVQFNVGTGIQDISKSTPTTKNTGKKPTAKNYHGTIKHLRFK